MCTCTCTVFYVKLPQEARELLISFPVTEGTVYQEKISRVKTTLDLLYLQKAMVCNI